MSHFVPDLDTSKHDFCHSQSLGAYAKKGGAVYTHELKPQPLECAHVPHHDASDSLLTCMDNQEKPAGSQTKPTTTGRDSLPALEVPLVNLPFQDDEMLAWLQYPFEDSFDKAYCAEELFAEGQSTHSHFVHDAFSYLSLREGERSRPAAIRPQAPPLLSERATTLDGPTMTHARDVGLTMPDGTNTALAAMAMGAQRAAGLLCQSGAEAFSRVRTTGQPSVPIRNHNVLAPATTSDVLSFGSHASKAGDGISKSSMRPLAKPNFRLFSCAVGSSKTSSRQIVCKNSANAEREMSSPGHGEGGDGASKLESMAIAGIAGFGTMAKQACPSVGETDGKCSSTLRSSPVKPTRQPLVAQLKDRAAMPAAESTATSLTRSASCNLERLSVGLSSIERALSMPRVKGPCANSVSLVSTETGRRPLASRKGLTFPDDEVTAIRNVDSSVQLEQAGHDCKKSYGAVTGRAPFSVFPMKHSAVRDVESTSCGPNTSQGQCETYEACDVTMASSSRISGGSLEKSSKEAAPTTTKRKAAAMEDSEIESKVFEEGNPASTRPSGPKRSRAAEIHNLSERKRRNKINVKMKALQDLIPNANKTDKASILDEAIEYVKMLQSQVQMMSLRSGMVGLPMLYSPQGVPALSLQQRLQPPHLNMDLGAGMELGRNIGANTFDVASLNTHGLMSGNPVLGQPFVGFPYHASGLQLGSSHGSRMDVHCNLQESGANGPYDIHPQQPLQLNMQANTDTIGTYLFQQQQHQQQEQQEQQQLQAHVIPHTDTS